METFAILLQIFLGLVRRRFGLRLGFDRRRRLPGGLIIESEVLGQRCVVVEAQLVDRRPGRCVRVLGKDLGRIDLGRRIRQELINGRWRRLEYLAHARLVFDLDVDGDVVVRSAAEFVLVEDAPFDARVLELHVGTCQLVERLQERGAFVRGSRARRVVRCLRSRLEFGHVRFGLRPRSGLRARS